VRFSVSGEPHFVIHKSLLEQQSCSFLQIREQAAANLTSSDEIGLQPGYLVRFFVLPNTTPAVCSHDFSTSLRG